MRKIELIVSSCVSGRQIPPLDPHENGNNGAIKLGKQTSQTGRRCCWPNLISLDLLEKQHHLLFSLRRDFVISVTWLLILKAVISILPMSSNARTRSSKLYFKRDFAKPSWKIRSNSLSKLQCQSTPILCLNQWLFFFLNKKILLYLKFRFAAKTYLLTLQSGLSMFLEFSL